MSKLLIKLIKIVLTIVILFQFFVPSYISSPPGKASYVHLYATELLLLILSIFILYIIWGRVNKKVLLIFGIPTAFCVITILGANIHSYFYNKTEKLAETKIELNRYEPFYERNDLLATLEEPSTFTITKDLPRLDGATALYPVYAAFVQAVYPKDEYIHYLGEYSDSNKIVLCTTTKTAYKRLIAKEADIIFVAGSSKEQEQAAKDKGVEMEFTLIGYEAFVFFVNSKNSIDNLTVEQIKGIYSGKIVNWKEVGGVDKVIKPFQREADSGSQTRMVSLMEDTPLLIPTEEYRSTGMSRIIANVAQYRNYDTAIGYSFLFYATSMVKNNNIKLLNIDGVKPTRENIANKTYPLTTQFYAVTLKGNENKNIKPFIKWILSEQGQELVEKTGYTPLK